MSSDPKKSISTDTLPPLVYAAVIGFVAWMVIAAWGFAGPGYAVGIDVLVYSLTH